jgi:hypothetical protein
LEPTRQVGGGGGGGAVVVVVGGSVVVGAAVDGGVVTVELGASLASPVADAHPAASANTTASPSAARHRDAVTTMDRTGYGAVAARAGRATDYTREMESSR